jgi:hypothetical protein
LIPVWRVHSDVAYKQSVPIFSPPDDRALDERSSLFLGAVVDGEMKVFGTKNPAILSPNNKQGMTGHSFRKMHLPVRPMGVSPQFRKVKQHGAKF